MNIKTKICSITKSINWDIWILLILFLGNAIFNLVFLMIRGELPESKTENIYKKVEICLTSTSILLAASGLLLSFQRRRVRDSSVHNDTVKTLRWFIIALLSGILNVAVMPTRLLLSEALEPKHVALWFWLYLTGPLMYIGLILGTIYFLKLIKAIN